MAGALSDVEWDACVLKPRRDPELEAYVRSVLPSLPSSVAYFSSMPWVVRSMTDLSVFGSPLVHVDPVLGDLIGLVVSQDNSCRYCFGLQRMMLRVHGIPESRVHKLEQGYLEAEIDPRGRAALDFARRLSRALPLVSGSDTAALRAAGWKREAIRELAFCAAYSLYMNRLMTLVAVPFSPVEGLADSWGVRLAAPLIRFGVLRRLKRARARAATLPPESARGPWAPLVEALAELPSARVLRRTLDAALASPVLPARAKALVFAVVARGLGSALCERESSELLGGSDLGASQIESILTHLGGPELDPVESALVPFARGTIRGRPLQLQQRARALIGVLTPEQLVEAVATSALANTIGRLGVVTELE